MNIKNKLYIAGALLLSFSPPVWADGAKSGKEPAPGAAVLREGSVGVYLSGQYAKTSGNFDKAIEYFRKIYADYPRDAEIATQLQNLLLVSGEIDEAIAIAEKIPPGADAESAGNTVSALLLSLRDIKRNDMAGAGATLRGAFGENSGQLWLPLVNTWLAVSAKRPAKPLTADDLHVDVKRATALIYYHLGLINAYAGFPQAAAENFKAVIDDPANPPTHIIETVQQFYRDHGKPAALAPIIEAYRAANPGAAVPQAPLPLSPQNGVAEVLFTMGSVMQSAGIPQDAVIYLHLARYLKPDFPLAALTLGDVYSDFKQYDKANALYKTLSKQDALYDKAQLHLAINENQKGKTSEALSLLSRLADAYPGQYEALVAKGDILRSQSRFKEAADAYSQALIRIGRPEPHHWPVFFARGASFERLGQWNEAERDLQQALALRPDQPDVLNYLGYGWLMRGEQHFQEAQAMIERAVKARPNDPQIIDSMGWALFSAKKYEEAVTYLEKALELMPGDPTINDHLGDVYWHLDRKVEARYQWERALTFSPENAEAEAIRKKLKDGLVAEIVKPAAPVVAEGVKPVTPVVAEGAVKETRVP